ncbi:hypothetical protein G7Y89_g840 [Cudoniella acicularis]|uniref:Uncharacterized protein n=1 Tax=Cudoniella acicularis TaxID=354080 RepID=A0A8H4W7J6_9HELO|nr:hypothetical protein G7Y89_g840 [Cudoniella acicularis]
MTLDQVPKSGFLWSPPSTEAPAEKPVKVSTSTEMFEERPAKRQKLFTSVIPKVGKLSAVKEIQFNEAPLKDISFRKFALKILPTISSLAVLIPAISVQPYFFSTGKPDAKPIMAFHKEGGHTGSWYTWGDRGIPFRASLKGNSWTPVNGIISFPHMWDEFESAADALDETKAEAFKFKRHGIHFLFCLEGAKENDTERELCLFPTLMRGEFHPVRSTVEAFSRKGKMGLPEEGKPLAAGLMVEKNERGCEMTVGVKTTTGQVCRYNIKLFD